jgi:hypothetical protein
MHRILGRTLRGGSQGEHVLAASYETNVTLFFSLDPVLITILGGRKAQATAVLGPGPKLLRAIISLQLKVDGNAQSA